MPRLVSAAAPESDLDRPKALLFQWLDDRTEKGFEIGSDQLAPGQRFAFLVLLASDVFVQACPKFRFWGVPISVRVGPRFRVPIASHCWVTSLVRIWGPTWFPLLGHDPGAPLDHASRCPQGSPECVPDWGHMWNSGWFPPGRSILVPGLWEPNGHAI